MRNATPILRHLGSTTSRRQKLLRLSVPSCPQRLFSTQRQQKRPITADPSITKPSLYQLTIEEQRQALVNELIKKEDRSFSREDLQSIASHPDRVFRFARLMDVLSKECRPAATLSLIRYVTEEDNMDKRIMLRTVQFLGYAIAQHNLANEDMTAILELTQPMAQKMPSTSMSRTMNAYTAACSDTSDLSAFYDSSGLILRLESFVALTSQAARRKDLTTVCRLCEALRFDFDSDPVVFSCMRTLSNNSKSVAIEVLHNYLSQKRKALDMDAFDSYLLPFIKQHGWNLSQTRIDRLQCAQCENEVRAARQLTQEEFNELTYTFESTFFELLLQKRGGTARELQALKTQTLGHNKEKVTLVIDYLNLYHARHYKWTENKFVQFLQSLQQTFPQIYVVGRKHALSNDFVYKLKQNCVKVFHCHHYSQDDMYSIALALWLGPKTFFMTNDKFGKERELLPKAHHQSLFEIWRDTHAVRFDPSSMKYMVGLFIPSTLAH
jgi:hypothetical protein